MLPQPSDGTAIVIRGVAVSIWDALSIECTIDRLQQVVSAQHPAIDTDAIVADVAETLAVLRAGGLVDVRPD